MDTWSWQEASDKTLRNLGEAQSRMAQSGGNRQAEIKAGFENLRRMLDQKERELTATLGDSSNNLGRQLRDCEQQMTFQRERLASGTAEIQRLLAAGNMGGVATKSHELETSTKAVREIEASATALVQAAGTGGSIDFGHAEQAVQALSVGATSPQGLVNTSAQGYAAPPITSYSGYTSTPPPASRPITSASPRTPFTPESTGRGTAVPNAIYINGVPENTTEADLRQVFSRFGEIKMINSRHIATGGFAFIFFSTDTGAAAALEKPKVMINGKQVNILAKKQLVPKDKS